MKKTSSWRAKLPLRMRSGTFAALAALLGLASIDKAQSAPASQPGFTTGLPIYAKLPEGLYYLNQTSSSFRDVGNQTNRANVNIFFFYYMSPWELAGGALSFVVAPTVVESYNSVAGYNIGFYNTYLGAQISWPTSIDGLRYGYRLSGYVPQDGPIASGYGVIEQRGGLTYFKDDWSALANIFYGKPIGDNRGPIGPDYIIGEFSVTKNFGKFQVGPIAHMSSDLSSPVPGYRRQEQAAVGGVIGYDFGPATLQVKVTTDVYQKNYGARETVVWTNLIIPLGSLIDQPASPKAIARKY